MKTIKEVLIALLCSLLICPASLIAAPVDGQVVAGQANIQKSGVETTIDQSSHRAVVNWQSFDISAKERVKHNMPSPSSAALHRVTGGGAASQLAGELKSNGHVFLVNPAGVVIHQGAKIDTGGFVATTNDITNENFMGGNLVFDKPGQPGAQIINKGHINARESGLAALVAPSVRNEGVIAARLGKVILASGDSSYKLDMYGDDLISFTVKDDDVDRLYATDGSPLGVENTGTIKAEGGVVLLSATQLDNIVSSVVNNQGTIAADSAEAKGGRIIFKGQGEKVGVVNVGTVTASSEKGDGGTVRMVADGSMKVSGVVEAKGANKGGQVDISGAEETWLTDVKINVAGVEGGLIRLGGEFQGGKDKFKVPEETKASFVGRFGPLEGLVETQRLTVDSASEISAGADGTLIAWSAQKTVLDGALAGRYLETSGDTLKINEKPLMELNGLWLIDPHNVTIIDGGSSSYDSSAEEVTIDAGWFGANAIIINADTIYIKSGFSSDKIVSLEATDIYCSSDIEINMKNDLTLYANNLLKIDKTKINIDYNDDNEKINEVLFLGYTKIEIDNSIITLKGTSLDISSANELNIENSEIKSDNELEFNSPYIKVENSKIDIKNYNDTFNPLKVHFTGEKQYINNSEIDLHGVHFNIEGDEINIGDNTTITNSMEIIGYFPWIYFQNYSDSVLGTITIGNDVEIVINDLTDSLSGAIDIDGKLEKLIIGDRSIISSTGDLNFMYSDETIEELIIGENSVIQSDRFDTTVNKIVFNNNSKIRANYANINVKEITTINEYKGTFLDIGLLNISPETLPLTGSVQPLVIPAGTENNPFIKAISIDFSNGNYLLSEYSIQCDIFALKSGSTDVKFSGTASSGKPHVINADMYNINQYIAQNYIDNSVIFGNVAQHNGSKVTISGAITSGITSFDFNSNGQIEYIGISDDINLNINDLIDAINSLTTLGAVITSEGDLILDSTIALNNNISLDFNAVNNILFNENIGLLGAGSLVAQSSAGDITVNGNIVINDGQIIFLAKEEINIASGVQIVGLQNDSISSIKMTAGEVAIGSNAKINLGRKDSQLLEIVADYFSAQAKAEIIAGKAHFKVTEAEFLGAKVNGAYEISLGGKSGGKAQEVIIEKSDQDNSSFDSGLILIKSNQLSIDNSSLIGNDHIDIILNNGNIGSKASFQSDGYIALAVENSLNIASGTKTAPIINANSVTFIGGGTITLYPYAVKTNFFDYTNGVVLKGEQDSREIKPHIFGLSDASFTGFGANILYEGMSSDDWPFSSLLLVDANGKLWPKGAIDTEFLNQAISALNKAINAQTAANQALTAAQVAQAKADQAFSDLQNLLPNLIGKKGSNADVHDYALAKQKAEDALEEAKSLLDKANKAQKDAIDAREAANYILQAAYEAGSEAGYNKAFEAIEAADKAEAKAKEAMAAAETAQRKANEALALLPEDQKQLQYAPDPESENSTTDPIGDNDGGDNDGGDKDGDLDERLDERTELIIDDILGAFGVEFKEGWMKTVIYTSLNQFEAFIQEFLIRVGDLGITIPAGWDSPEILAKSLNETIVKKVKYLISIRGIGKLSIDIMSQILFDALKDALVEKFNLQPDQPGISWIKMVGIESLNVALTTLSNLCAKSVSDFVMTGKAPGFDTFVSAYASAVWAETKKAFETVQKYYKELDNLNDSTMKFIAGNIGEQIMLNGVQGAFKDNPEKYDELKSSHEKSLRDTLDKYNLKALGINSVLLLPTDKLMDQSINLIQNIVNLVAASKAGNMDLKEQYDLILSQIIIESHEILNPLSVVSNLCAQFGVNFNYIPSSQWPKAERPKAERPLNVNVDLSLSPEPLVSRLKERQLDFSVEAKP
jgi:filamentous hemagglutinin family protein